MFFKPEIYYIKHEKLTIDPEAQIVLSETFDYLKERLQRIVLQSQRNVSPNSTVVKKLTCSIGLPKHLRFAGGKSVKPLWGKENVKKNIYVISAEEEICLYAKDYTGLVYAVSTLEQIVKEGDLRKFFLFDAPETPMRCYRTFVPSRKEMEDFKFMVDHLLVEYHYNYLIMELGGAMEYKKHPEINTAWEKYCTDLKEYSGKATKIQQTLYPWRKNCIHTDNGGGSWLTQEELHEIQMYCAERGIEIIPEVPSLSHCDYMLLTNPDIRERKTDEWADTYCPSNPKSYELLYDILDEVADLFQPRFIDICHDEIQSIGVCEVCAQRDPVDLLVEDITKIYNYLKNKGIRCIMACDSLLNFVDDEGFCQFETFGKPFGGAEYGLKGDDWYNPPLYKALGRIPKDIILAHWLWGTEYGSVKLEQEILKQGYQFIFFNMKVNDFEDYKNRAERSGMGGICSNWGSFSLENMQRNLQTFHLIYSAYAYWCHDYDDDMRDEIFKKTISEICQLTEERLQIDKSHYIEFIHNTNWYIPYKTFYDGVMIEDEKYIIGFYVITYTDGTTKQVELKYGRDISNCNVLDSYFNPEMIEMIGRTQPLLLDGKMYYKWRISNPCPNKVVENIIFRCAKGKEKVKVFVKQLKVVTALK